MMGNNNINISREIMKKKKYNGSFMKGIYTHKAKKNCCPQWLTHLKIENLKN